jgi:hypothetical protein
MVKVTSTKFSNGRNVTEFSKDMDIASAEAILAKMTNQYGKGTEMVTETFRYYDWSFFSGRTLVQRTLKIGLEEEGEGATGPASGYDAVRGDYAACRGCGIEISSGTASGLCGECSAPAEDPEGFTRVGDKLVPNHFEGDQEKEDCDRCYGKGWVTVGPGYVENGVYKGATGICYRCRGAKQVTRYANKMGTANIQVRGF